MFKTFAFAATALTLAAGSAFAAPSDDARTHFQAIASGDTQIVMRAYADQAQLNWVGGPLDGTYATTDAIRGTWEKFGKAVGPLKLTIGSIEESANPKGSTVSANVVFEGKMPIKVRYVLTYREGTICESASGETMRAIGARSPRAPMPSRILMMFGYVRDSAPSAAWPGSEARPAAAARAACISTAENLESGCRMGNSWGDGMESPSCCSLTCRCPL